MKTAESHNAELTGCIKFLPMPPLPKEALKFIKEAQLALEKLSAKTELLTGVHVEGTTPSTESL